MPPAQLNVGPELDIQLDNIGRPYQAGDVITGRVVRQAHAVSPRATVTIELLGRAKSKIVVTSSNGNTSSNSYYRGRFNFFDAAQTRRQLHDGPIHVPPGGSPEAWEFAIDVPLTPSPQAVLNDAKGPKSSFSSLGPNDIASYPLPSSFTGRGRRHSTRFEAYVEYHLEASLLQQGSHHGKAVTATLPIQLRTPPMPYPLVNFDLKRRSWPYEVRTYHLVPGMENVELSFKQKSQQFFHSSKVPTLGFTLEYSCPAVIQLGNLTPIPFLVRIIPERKRTSEVLHDVPVTARLSYLELVLKADTTVIAPGTWGIHTGDGTVKHNIHVPVMLRVLQTTTQGANNASAIGPRGEDSITQKPLPVGENTTKEEIMTEHARHLQSSSGTPASAENSNPGPSSEQPPTYKASTRQPHTVDGGPLLLPCSWGAEDMSLDIGAAVALRLYPTHATALDCPIAGTSPEPICPSFTTYCIRHSHRLKWKMVIDIAGETVKLENEQPITVMGPSDL